MSVAGDRAHALGIVSACVFLLSLLVGSLSLAWVLFAARPNSDEAAGVMLLGSILAGGGYFLAAVFAGIALFVGRGQPGSKTLPILTLIVSLLAMCAVPVVALVVFFATTPIGIH
jgi:hypothetical protein